MIVCMTFLLDRHLILSLFYLFLYATYLMFYSPMCCSEQLNASNVSEENEARPAEDAENQDPNEHPEGEEGAEVDQGPPEPQEMTLDEWKAQQMTTRPKTEFKVRQAGEGCDNSQWKKMTVLPNKKEEDEESEEEDDDEVSGSDFQTKYCIVYTVLIMCILSNALSR